MSLWIMCCYLAPTPCATHNQACPLVFHHVGSSWDLRVACAFCVQDLLTVTLFWESTSHICSFDPALPIEEVHVIVRRTLGLPSGTPVGSSSPVCNTLKR